MLNGLLENIWVNFEIGVHQAVPHTDDLVPRNFRRFGSGVRIYLIRCLSDDLDCLYQRPHKLAIAIQILSDTVANKVSGLPRGIQHVPHPYLVILLHTGPWLPRGPGLGNSD